MGKKDSKNQTNQQTGIGNNNGIIKWKVSNECLHVWLQRMGKKNKNSNVQVPVTK